MNPDDDTTKAWADKIDGEHRPRARSMSELTAKLIMKRKGLMPRNFEEWCQDMDIIKRAHEHIGACNAMNEIRTSLFPSPPPGDPLRPAPVVAQEPIAPPPPPAADSRAGVPPPAPPTPPDSLEQRG